MTILPIVTFVNKAWFYASATSFVSLRFYTDIARSLCKINAD